MHLMIYWFFVVLLPHTCISSIEGKAKDYYFKPPRHADIPTPMGLFPDSWNKRNVSRRYLIYGVNLVEGFNLRADVYIRVANLMKLLQQEQDWVLVLPPWEHLYHWKSDFYQDRIPWRLFYDVPSLRKYTRVTELETFFKETGQTQVVEVIYLQGYAGGWKGTTWEEKIDEAPCLEDPGYNRDENGAYVGFFGFDEFSAKRVRCFSVQGTADILAPLLLRNITARSVFVDRFEEVLHINYGQIEYWKARRSLVFAKHLREEGDKFRREILQSTDEADGTVMDEDWTKNHKKEGSARGGPYLAVHLRRADFLYSRQDQLPTLDGVIKQINKLLKEHKLNKVFLATDTEKKDVEYLKSKLPLVTYEPSQAILEKYGDGGVAIIDQWICAHARYFTGTTESTFSFRIQEEREILGFNANTTFNSLCSDKEIGKCEQPSRWRIVY